MTDEKKTKIIIAVSSLAVGLLVGVIMPIYSGGKFQIR